MQVERELNGCNKVRQKQDVTGKRGRGTRRRRKRGNGVGNKKKHSERKRKRRKRKREPSQRESREQNPRALWLNRR